MRRTPLVVLALAGLYGCYDYNYNEEDPAFRAGAGGTDNGARPSNASDELNAKPVPAGDETGTTTSSSSSSSGSTAPPASEPTLDAGTPPPPPPPPACTAGGLYCGGGKVPGDARTLHRCNADGKTGTVVSRCANSCLTNQPAANDACSAPTKCVVGGSYCGGDKVNGDPNVLFTCTGDGFSAVVSQVCAAGCFVAPPGTDDRCN